MKYEVLKDRIQVFSKEDFNPQHILECGQIFAYTKCDDGYQVFSKDKRAKIIENETGYEIITLQPAYFVNFFDLDTDYCAIKKELGKCDLLKEPIKFG